jgi:hypothetical protein
MEVDSCMIVPVTGEIEDRHLSEKIYHLVRYFNIDKNTIKKKYFLLCLLGGETP